MFRNVAEHAEEDRDVIIDHPNRDKVSSKATRAIVVLLLLVSAGLTAVITFGGWSKLAGMKPISIAYIVVYLVMAFYVLRWNRGVLPLAAALAIILGIFAAIAGPQWFERDKSGFTNPALDADLLGLLTCWSCRSRCSSSRSRCAASSRPGTSRWNAHGRTRATPTRRASPRPPSRRQPVTTLRRSARSGGDSCRSRPVPRSRMWHARRWRNWLTRCTQKSQCPQGHVGSSPTRRMKLCRMRSDALSWTRSEELVVSGLNDCEVARRTGVPRTTDSRLAQSRFLPLQVREARSPDDHRHDFDRLPPSYAYLLGLYLGDGNITRQPARRVPPPDHARSRLSDDHRRTAGEAMAEVMPSSRASVQLRRDGACVEVYSFSKHWPCLFPQHGPGRKHERRIALTDWQRAPLRPAPSSCFAGSSTRTAAGRSTASGAPARHTPIRATPSPTTPPTSAGSSATYLDALDIAWRPMGWRNISIARRDAVAKLDAFIGPKA